MQENACEAPCYEREVIAALETPFNDLSGDLAKLTRYVALDLLFTPSPLYNPSITGPKLPRNIQVDISSFEGDPAHPFAANINPALTAASLSALQSMNNFSVQHTPYPLDGRVADIWNCYFRQFFGGSSCYGYRLPFGDLFSYYNDHLNQYLANAESPTRAREGNIHHGDPAHRSLPMISHLGAMVSNVVGAADSQRRLGRPAVGLAFFGDGGSSTGDIHETLNLASLLSLPVLFVIQNNHYAYSTPLAEQYATGTELWRRAAGYGIEGMALDATGDVLATARTLGEAIARVRATSRPMLIEARTLRLRGHGVLEVRAGGAQRGHGDSGRGVVSVAGHVVDDGSGELIKLRVGEPAEFE